MMETKQPIIREEALIEAISIGGVVASLMVFAPRIIAFSHITSWSICDALLSSWLRAESGLFRSIHHLLIFLGFMATICLFHVTIRFALTQIVRRVRKLTRVHQ